MTRKKLFIVAIILFVIIMFSGQFFALFTDFLWFKAINYVSVFWKMFLAKASIFAIFSFIFLIVLWLNLYIARFTGPAKINWEIPVRRQDMVHIVEFQPRQVNLFILLVSILLTLIMGGWPAFNKWETLLKFIYQVPFGRVDPIFNKDISFFIFSYPVLQFLQKWFFYVVAICLLSSGFIYLKDRAIHLKLGDFRFDKQAKAHLSTLCALLLLLVAWDKRLKMFGLLYSSQGVAFGASYTDMHAQMVAYWAILVIAAACAVLFWINLTSRGWKLPIIGVGILLVVSILISGIYPTLIQKFVVEPNELKNETPYIKYNIHYTRQGYNIDSVQEKDFPVYEALSMQDILDSASTIRNIKLWDKQPLKKTYAQMQELRPYYKFTNIDEDRYLINGIYTQVMLSGRELIQEQLPDEAKTWENLQFKYTHGYGLCLSPVNQVTVKGLPNLTIMDIPPVSPSNLKVTRPELYYGENTYGYVIVNSKSEEFDYPKGDKNAYTNYAGKGGVPIGSFWSRIIFALGFSDPKIFLTGYIQPESRIMFHRQIKEMTNTIAPFLLYDSDPYLVLAENGSLFWIQDAYTTTDKYPYSEPYRLSPELENQPNPGNPLSFLRAQAAFLGNRINYIRNAVKIAIDAYNGSLTFYISDPEDSIIKTYQRIFPDLFKDIKDMPNDLKSHIRYPADLFKIQTSMYATYHMQDPQVFYNKEDLWQSPLKITGQNAQYNQLMDPYYVTLKLEDNEQEEFLNMLPFTPFGEKKNNMIAWMCARCDVENYGKLLVYKFPKDKLIYGPRQIEARIDQQTDISKELTLWSQRGSEVFRGELLVIPIKNSILYVEPVYLMASQDALPELKRIIVAFGDIVEMRETIDEALQAVFMKQGVGYQPAQKALSVVTEPAPAIPEALSDSVTKLIAEANELFKEAIQSQKAGDWARYGNKLSQLDAVLNKMSLLSSKEKKEN